ncbi:hypothetical protein [Prosthecochloris sp.]|nr:hypothetical protein [Prosthecochloris sp.]
MDITKYRLKTVSEKLVLAKATLLSLLQSHAGLDPASIGTFSER